MTLEQTEEISIGDIAREAADLVEGGRSSYGDIQHQFSYLSRLVSAYLQHEVTPKECAHIMILVKLSRDVIGGYNRDNHLDMIGYATLAEYLAQ